MPDTQTNPPGSSSSTREALLSSPPVPQDSPAGAAVGSAIQHITGSAYDAVGPSYTSSPIHGLLNPLSQALGPPHASPDESITLKPRDQSTIISASPASPASHLQGLHITQSSATSLTQPPQKMSLPSPPDEQQQQQQQLEPSKHSSRKTSRSATAQLLVRARLAGTSLQSEGEERDTDLLLPSRGEGRDASSSKSDGQRTGSEYHAFHVGEPGSAGTSNGLLSRFAGDDDEESALLQPHETNSSPLGGGPGDEDRTGAGPGWHSKGGFFFVEKVGVQLQQHPHQVEEHSVVQQAQIRYIYPRVASLFAMIKLCGVAHTPRCRCGARRDQRMIMVVPAAYWAADL